VNQGVEKKAAAVEDLVSTKLSMVSESSYVSVFSSSSLLLSA
jgi:hypothetical protein